MLLQRGQPRRAAANRAPCRSRCGRPGSNTGSPEGPLRPSLGVVRDTTLNATLQRGQPWRAAAAEAMIGAVVTGITLQRGQLWRAAATDHDHNGHHDL